jgi:carboxyl-terminal processing protease
MRKAVFILLLLVSAGAGAVCANVLLASMQDPALRKMDRALSSLRASHETNASALVDGAIRGMLDTLGDDFTEYIKRGASSAAEAGIGLEIGSHPDGISIRGVRKDSPAALSGLRAGDVIVEIDDVDAVDMGEAEALERLRGPIGTRVEVTVVRAGRGDELLFVVKRESQAERSVFASVEENRIGRLTVRGFTESTGTELRDAFDSLKTQALNGLIVDLRGNRGGMIAPAVELADRLLRAGDEIVWLETREGGRRLVAASERAPDVQGVPIAVLVDDETASSAEIVAAALQQSARAAIVGRRTYGKGTVQTIVDLSDGSYLKLTYARWFTPQGEWLQGKGVSPDLFVEEEELVVAAALRYIREST